MKVKDDVYALQCVQIVIIDYGCIYFFISRFLTGDVERSVFKSLFQLLLCDEGRKKYEVEKCKNVESRGPESAVWSLVGIL
jgi:hypothetical protein